jgi:hypothetical protein
MSSGLIMSSSGSERLEASLREQAVQDQSLHLHGEAGVDHLGLRQALQPQTGTHHGHRDGQLARVERELDIALGRPAVKSGGDRLQIAP